MPLPKDAKKRKEYPIYTGVLAYFPDALAEVAHVSFVGNQQHNPGQPLHWDRSKSQDQKDAETRHLVEPVSIGGSKFDSDGVRHSAKKAWRALADLQLEIEAEQGSEDKPGVEGGPIEPDYTLYCEAVSPREYYGCTRTKGHAGKHQAHISSGASCHYSTGELVIW